MRAQAVVFDLDGTLVDSKPGIVRAMRRAASEEWPDLDVKDIDVEVGPALHELVQRTFPAATAAERKRVAERYRSAYDEEEWRTARPYGGVAELLQALESSRVALMLLTNKPERPTRQLLELLGWTHLFNPVLCRGPHPGRTSKLEMAQGLLQRGVIRPDRAVVVGDTSEDAAAAAAAKARFVAAAYGYGRVSGEVQIMDPLDLLRYLELQ